ncbi:hypothetical protein CROQUDRAFT_92433 [Cronartium quercuum f. sp. fusiforme G11]|uniref:Uncharacterized protein n=1 Tax=Cronartium quercuum f. sp. fusiforme G11 TaxID=708437 RepID=A0A9P6TBT9_9BASI|nr:hypothetical protein CROQUDRAFT_92433 [Cronartium quercuum f. sp. fusiforme G11]
MSQPANTIPTRPNTNHHLISLEPIDSEPNTAHHPIKVHAKPKSLEGAAKKFSKWLKKTELEVTQIARSTQSHILVIGVSTKLNANSFQMIAGSLLALQFMKTHQQTYVECNFPAEFQSFSTGVEVHDLKPAMKLAISNQNRKQTLACEALANLLNKHLPDGEEKAWPWVNCVAKLADWSLQIAFTKDAKTKLITKSLLSKSQGTAWV